MHFHSSVGWKTYHFDFTDVLLLYNFSPSLNSHLTLLCWFLFGWLVRVPLVVGWLFLPWNFGAVVGTYEGLLPFCECTWGGESIFRWWGHLNTICLNQTFCVRRWWGQREQRGGGGVKGGEGCKGGWRVFALPLHPLPPFCPLCTLYPPLYPLPIFALLYPFIPLCTLCPLRLPLPPFAPFTPLRPFGPLVKPGETFTAWFFKLVIFASHSYSLFRIFILPPKWSLCNVTWICSNWVTFYTETFLIWRAAMLIMSFNVIHVSVCR